jgi:hypothetical protein
LSRFGDRSIGIDELEETAELIAEVFHDPSGVNVPSMEFGNLKGLDNFLPVVSHGGSSTYVPHISRELLAVSSCSP